MNKPLLQRLSIAAATLLGAVSVVQAEPSYVFKLAAPGVRATAPAPSTPATPTDPYFGNVTALLALDGANGSTAISDAKGGSYSLGTGAQITTATSKFGDASLSLVSGYLMGPASATGFGTADFTVEMFARSSSTNLPYQLFDARPKSTNGAYFSIGTNPGLLIYTNTANLITSSTPFPHDGAWHHVAYSRNSGVGRLYLDGAMVASGTDTTNYLASAWGIGWNAFGVAVNGLYVDDVRITKGVGRYTANFTVPTTAFPTQ